MPSCNPYGNPKNAKIMVIGHDPRLRISEAEAGHAFFLEYLTRDTLTKPSDKRKKDFAVATVEYIKSIVGASISLDYIYFTNLCNKFLERPIGGGTVLISDDEADKGITEIEKDIKSGLFRATLPMSLQVFYHLVRTEFVDDQGENLKKFLEMAKPNPNDIQRNAYKSSKAAPFLLVCGKIFHHRLDSVPIIPILHVKQRKNPIMEKHYGLLMKEAERNTRNILKANE